jgi:hypothetical protein
VCADSAVREGRAEDATNAKGRAADGFTHQALRVVFAACGDSFTGAVSCRGDLFMWGINGNGQLGLGDTFNRATPSQVARECFEGEDVAMIAVGQSHCAALTDASSSLYTWGWNAFGQLGLGDEVERHQPVRISRECFGGGAVIQVSQTLRARAREQVREEGGGEGEGGEGIDEPKSHMDAHPEISKLVPPLSTEHERMCRSP